MGLQHPSWNAVEHHQDVCQSLVEVFKSERKLTLVGAKIPRAPLTALILKEADPLSIVLTTVQKHKCFGCEVIWDSIIFQQGL